MNTWITSVAARGVQIELFWLTQREAMRSIARRRTVTAID